MSLSIALLSGIAKPPDCSTSRKLRWSCVLNVVPDHAKCEVLLSRLRDRVEMSKKVQKRVNGRRFFSRKQYCNL